MKLSVIIITNNEEGNIQACLESVAFAGQWIIVDSGSTDATVEIARRFGATVIQTPDWPGFGPQKNRALDAADGDWILSLDADERIPGDLREEILAVTGAANGKGSAADGAMARADQGAPGRDAYEMPRLSSYCGRFIHHSGWRPDHILRLFKRGAARFSDDLVHERLVLREAPGPGLGVGRLKSSIVHYSYRDDEAYLRKLQQYSTLGARQAFAAGKRCGFGSALSHATAGFVRSYFLRRGFLDGAAGLMVAFSTAESTYHKYFKLMLLSEAEGRRP
jgi:glycosyltransferase involved in cell wall biosynthesis